MEDGIFHIDKCRVCEAAHLIIRRDMALRAMVILAVLVIAVSVLALVLICRCKPEPTLPEILQAIEQVESGGDVNAIGDSGRAVGCLQIWKIMVDDVNRILKRNKYTYRDRLDRQKSYAMFKIYTNHYCTEKRLKQKPTAEIIARNWNGGPNGYKEQSTIKYWYKVRKGLKCQN